MRSSCLNFTGFPDQSKLNQNFNDTIIKSSEEQKETYFRIANYCRDWYSPVFSSDVDRFPEKAEPEIPVVKIDLKEVVKEEGIIPENKATLQSKVPDTKDLTIPPLKIEESTLLNALLIGLGAALVVKILS